MRASFEDLADDALAGVRLLKTRPEIDARHIGLMGASQSGWIVALAAARSPDPQEDPPAANTMTGCGGGVAGKTSVPEIVTLPLAKETSSCRRLTRCAFHCCAPVQEQSRG